MNTINSKVRDVVLKELEQGAFTTAPLAARILAKFNVQQAVTPLRAALDSDDYYLAGEAMVALARLNDSYSQPKIGTILSQAENPALILKGIRALELLMQIIPYVYSGYSPQGHRSALYRKRSAACTRIVNGYPKRLLLYV